MSITEERVTAGLADLRTHAPAELAGRVLDELGLADAYVQIEGPLGPLFVAYGPNGISLVHRADDSPGAVDAGAFEEEFMATFGRPIHRVAKAPVLIERVIRARLSASGASGGTNVKVPLDLDQLPEFERQVLRKTMEIPRGEVRPYAWIAAELGRPLAVRAVGNALARNPIPFVIPCHRVVRSDGRIGNYGAGGPTAKRALLEAEGLDTAELERLPAANVRFIGSDTTNIYCYPSCHNARRIRQQHRVPFHTVEETRRAGYRACLECRPVAGPTRAAVA